MAKAANKTYPSGAEYEPVGTCAVCAATVYVCITHPVRDEGMDQTYAAVFVPQGQGSDELATTYCQEHDPNRHLRGRAGKPVNELLPGDSWSPLG